ncbi:MAG: MFS transporter [Phaeovulum sp.]|uniref:MFS transporter n=1 Tax=Phaeovulum sp. TaxID=2934796 RepID=UPI002736CD11|nr:MFS transporter [Phaeovulum sp.]MDP3861507.1 MFS transporter [Phaeovulum sp.]
MAGQNAPKASPMRPALARFLLPGPVVALGVTQIVGYGTLYYAFGVLVPAISRELGMSQGLLFGGFSAALLAGGLVALPVGRRIDRIGARRVMAAGSVAAAVALGAMALAVGPATLIAALVATQLASALVLYDAAFAALAQGLGSARARRAITQMTLFGGFASTLFWPLTEAMAGAIGWRATLGCYALVHLLLCLPLHLRLRASPDPEAMPAARLPARVWTPLPAASQARALGWLTLSLSTVGFVFAALTAQWVTALGALGVASGAAVAAGALMGPAQVGVRLLEMLFGQRLHPLGTAMISSLMLVAALALLLLGGSGPLTVALFAAVFGLAQGLSSLVRGAAVLALFGPEGFAARLGMIAIFRMTSGALAPVALAFALTLWRAEMAMFAALALAAISALALMMVPRA